MKTIKQLIPLLAFTIFFNESFAQVKRCSTMDVLQEQIDRDPSVRERMNQMDRTLDHFQNQVANQQRGGVMSIPVVVHVIHNGEAVGTGTNISDAQVLSQIDVLNEDFRRLNPDANQTPVQFLGVASDAEIEFCMASIDPQGNQTDGIDRIDGGNASWSTNQVDNTVKPQTTWNSNFYLNMWVLNFSGGGLLGYATFPGGSQNRDGVVIGYKYFGRWPDNPNNNSYNGGRTTTHEVGHWLGLYHIWGDGPCGNDDSVNDTPESDDANYGCPNGHTSCGTEDMIQNYMDYTNDACMNLFTVGQGNRMRSAISSFRSSLLSSPACIPQNTFSISGQVVDAATNQGIPNAVVLLTSNTYNYEITCDNNGNFVNTNFLEATYDVYGGAWGYITEQAPTQSIDSNSGPITIAVNNGYYDDFMIDLGWTTSGDAETGKWVSGEPVGTVYNGAPCNADADIVGDLGNKAYLTGNGSTDYWLEDVDDGNTVLISPTINLSGYNEPILEYYRWFYNGGGNGGTPDDELVITLDNGQNSVVLETIDVNDSQLSQWVYSRIRIKDHLTPSTYMTLTVETSDLASSGHLVEAGFDYFRITDSLSSSVSTNDLTFDWSIHPNPTSGQFILETGVMSTPVMVEVFDVAGKLLTNEMVNGRSNLVELSGAAEGFYFVKVSNGIFNEVKKLMISK